jgi:hypothetical protein
MLGQHRRYENQFQHYCPMVSSLKALCQEAEPDENMKARKTLPPDSYLSIGSFPVISSASQRHENIPEVCRIHSSIPKGIMTVSRLHLRGSTLIQPSITIGFPRAPYVIRCFRQMRCHRSHRLCMSLACSKTLIESGDMPIRMAPLVQTDRLRRLDKGPLR